MDAREGLYWAKVDRRGEDECWPWLAGRNPFGYGTFRSEGDQLAHRYGYRLAFGEIGEGRIVCHRCDNPPCQNPRHLFVGTPADNMADKVSKGRQSRVRQVGETNPGAKLTDETVAVARQRYSQGETQAAIAADLGVSQTAVGKVLRGERWEGESISDRGRRARGEAHPMAKMTDAQVAEARARYDAGGVTQRALAEEYGVTDVTMSAIVRRKYRVIPE